MFRIPQILRRFCQFGVLIFVVYAALNADWRNYKVAHNNARLVGLIHGEQIGEAYASNEKLLGFMNEDTYEQSLKFLGMPWSSTVFGLESTDPTLAAAHVVSSRGVSGRLFLGLLIPLLLALLFGKVFCSHLCPARLLFELGQGVRAGLSRLGLPLPHVRAPARMGGWVFLGGLLATVSLGVVAWFFILPYLALTTSIFLYVTAGVVLSLLAVTAVWVFIDMFFAPGLFCHALCPTGFLLEQFGRFSFLRLKRGGEGACPDKCNQCESACPYELSPKHETHRPACDNCGKCVPACPQSRLERVVRLPVIAIVALVASFALPSVAQAHHNKGLPHYGYYENYPQVPTDEYVAIRGKWEIGATFFNFQGLTRRDSDTPKDVKIYAYLYDLEADYAYMGEADFEIRKDGKVIARFERLQVDSEAVYSSRETFPESGDYQLVAIMGDTEVKLDFYIELAGNGINWFLVIAIGLPVLLVFGLAFHGRRRTKKRLRAPKKTSGAAVLVLLALGASSSAHADQPTVLAPPGPSEQEFTAVHIHDGEHVPHSGDVLNEDGDVICQHCGMINCTMSHVESEDGEQVMIMAGIPLWLFLCAVIGILLLSFVGVEWLSPKVGPGFRKNLIANKRVYALVRSRWFQVVPQLLMAAILVLLLYVGLVGARAANLTPVAVWTIWWAALIFFVLLFASAWCLICPWDGISNLMSRLRLAAKVDTLSMALPYPKWLANVYPAIILFIGLTWLELGFEVTTDPRATAYMGLAMIGMAVVFALLFDGKRFCAHACPVGRICGIYSTFAPVEIRGKKERVCQSCKTEDCLNGNEKGYPCPTGLSLKTITSSSMCTMCTECIKTCNKQNVAINLRPFGADLRDIKSPRIDEAWLAVSLLVLTLFHGLTMTPAWESFMPGEWSLLRWVGMSLGVSRVVAFSLAMVVVCGAAIGLYWLACRATAWLGGKQVSPRLVFVNFAYSLLPVALFYHLAHNFMHLTMEGGHIVPMLSDPMGSGADYLGTADMKLDHLVPEATSWYIQVGLILIGHVIGILVAHRFGHRLFSDRKSALRASLPLLLLMVAISVGGLTLMHLDMNMRVGRM
ncbi:MAG: 4Fe-4S binding protein [Myxococcales bacterium]|nr:4Fe-4S binding protein [Myxococcales bacterium]